MKNQVSGVRCQVSVKSICRRISCALKADSWQLKAYERGFTLIETLVAVTLLSVAIGAPMALTTKSLAVAYYARDQITAFHLAQEAIEAVRHTRDNNILQTALGTPTILFAEIIPPGKTSQTFTIDTRDDNIVECPSPPEGCPPLKVDPDPDNPQFYGYETGWTPTRFTRTVYAEFVPNTSDEVRVSVNVEWKTGAFQSRSVKISENLYRWVEDQSGI